MNALTPAIGFARTNGNDQRRLIEAWAARTGHTITNWTVSLDEALALVKAGPAEAVVAVDLDRFDRNATVVLDWLDKLKAVGGRAETLDGPAAPSTAETILRLADELDEVNERARTADEDAYYRRRAPSGTTTAGAQQQAAEVWNVLETLGYEVVEVDGARLGDEPPRP